jgi:DNA polymerase III subunit epsilon
LLADKSLFGDVADEFLAFVADAPLVAHNAGFDIAFLERRAEARPSRRLLPMRIGRSCRHSAVRRFGGDYWEGADHGSRRAA